LLRKEKERIVEELQGALEGTKVAILSDYRGLNVGEMTVLRNQLRQASVNYRVVKNALIKLALKNTDLEPLIDQISGPTAVAFSYEDPISPAKILEQFGREQPKLEIKGGIVEGKLVDQAGVKRLAQIPSREVLLGRLVSFLGAGPTHLVTVLSLNLQKLLQLLNAIRLQKEESS
jgi:large subunit ribosomal protein L10